MKLCVFLWKSTNYCCAETQGLSPENIGFQGPGRGLQQPAAIHLLGETGQFSSNALLLIATSLLQPSTKEIKQMKKKITTILLYCYYWQIWSHNPVRFAFIQSCSLGHFVFGMFWGLGRFVFGTFCNWDILSWDVLCVSYLLFIQRNLITFGKCNLYWVWILPAMSQISFTMQIQNVPSRNVPSPNVPLSKRPILKTAHSSKRPILKTSHH